MSTKKVTRTVTKGDRTQQSPAQTTTTTTTTQPRRRAARRRARRIVKSLATSLRESNLPVNEQEALSRIVASAPIGIEEYMKCLVYPKSCATRVPDSFPRKTALWSSIMTVAVPYNLDATPDSGRFSACVRPNLGNLSAPERYKIGLVNPTSGPAGGWPQYLNLPASFIGNSLGRDVRFDVIAPTLVQPGLGTSTLVGDQPSGTPAKPFGNTVTPSTGYGLSVTYANTGAFFPPPGIYRFVVNVYDPINPIDTQISVTPVNGAIITYDINSDMPGENNNTVAGYLSVRPGTSAAFAGGISFSTTDFNPLTTVSTVNFTQAFDDNPQLFQTDNYGSVQEMRPVAMSVLFTYTGPELLNGGNVAIGYLPGRSEKSDFYGPSNNQFGNLDEWDNLAQLPGTYNGPLKDGAYAWWAPQTIEDYTMVTPDQANDANYPPIIVSGQFVPGPGAASSGTVGRLEVVTIYEGVTNNIVFPQKYQQGSQHMMDSAFTYLAQQPHCMANATHMDWISRLLKGFKTAQNVYAKAKPLVGPISDIASDVASLFI